MSVSPDFSDDQSKPKSKSVAFRGDSKQSNYNEGVDEQQTNAQPSDKDSSIRPALKSSNVSHSDTRSIQNKTPDEMDTESYSMKSSKRQPMTKK